MTCTRLWRAFRTPIGEPSVFWALRVDSSRVHSPRLTGSRWVDTPVLGGPEVRGTSGPRQPRARNPAADGSYLASDHREPLARVIACCSDCVGFRLVNPLSISGGLGEPCGLSVVMPAYEELPNLREVLPSLIVVLFGLVVGVLYSRRGDLT